jgi:PTH2 family peptidyl-tRNA hydrolase
MPSPPNNDASSAWVTVGAATAVMATTATAAAMLLLRRVSDDSVGHTPPTLDTRLEEKATDYEALLYHIPQSVFSFITSIYNTCTTMQVPLDTNKATSSTNAMYFFAGALIPTVTFILFRNQLQHTVVNTDDDYDSDDDENHVPSPTEGIKPSEWGLMHAPYKMVLCVNQELGMGKGKIAAQCCHAAVGCYKRASKACPAGLAAWERTGCAKIALKCPTEAEMEDIALRAVQKGLPCYLVEDAGRTQIAAGSRTVLGIGPAPVSVFEGVTDHLKLF